MKDRRTGKDTCCRSCLHYTGHCAKDRAPCHVPRGSEHCKEAQEKRRIGNVLLKMCVVCDRFKDNKEDRYV